MSDNKKIKCNVCGKINVFLSEDYDEDLIICEYCNSLKFTKPKNESILFSLQNRYLKTRNSDILGKMYLIMYDIAYNLTTKKLPNSRKFQIEYIEDKTSETVEKIITYYMTKPNFRIDNSFTGYISQVVLYPLFNKQTKQRQQSEISIEAIISKINKQNNNISPDSLNLDFHLSGSEEIAFDIESIDHETEWDKKSHNYSFNQIYKYKDDDYIIDYANIDFFIDDILKAIEGCLNAVAQKYSLKEALIQSIFFYHYFGKSDKTFFNKLVDIFGDSSGVKFKTIINYFEPSFKNFQEKLLILRNNLYENFLRG